MPDPYAAFLMRLLSQPTAPFREQTVIACVTEFLQQHGVPHCFDRIGNLLLGVASLGQYRDLLGTPDKTPLRVFIAHMDHPGFHGVRWIAPRVLRIRWHGGSPTKHLSGARMWLADANGWRSEGVLHKAKLHPKGYAIETAEVHLTAEQLARGRPAAKQLFGGFQFRKPVWRSGGRLYAQAADDLIGVFCIVVTATEASRRRRPAPFVGLLTRAEEVGLVGAVGHFETGYLQAATRPIVCVSLEASRTLPGAVVGKGPIVRLGDRRTPFHPDYSQVLTALAERVMPGQYQRRIMDGGSCEGSAATAYGLPTIAMAVPLGNYHNQGLEGGPDCRGPGGPAPEFVHLNDIEGQRRLCLGLLDAGLRWDHAWRDVKARLRQNFAEYRLLLER